MVADFLAKAGSQLQPNEELYFDHVETSFEHLLTKDIKYVATRWTSKDIMVLILFYVSCFFPSKK